MYFVKSNLYDTHEYVDRCIDGNMYLISSIYTINNLYKLNYIL